MKEQVLVCPVCGGALLRTERQYTCPAGHSFDVAKEGYVNLLCTSKSADKMGDSKESAAARHAFLERGYYGCLKEALTPLLHGNVLDICCGEGYYDSVPADGALYGFDLSKTMVRLAAKRKNGGQYFVANLARMPVAEGSIDTALHLFAPFHDRAFARVLAPGGRLYSVTPVLAICGRSKRRCTIGLIPMTRSCRKVRSWRWNGNSGWRRKCRSPRRICKPCLP